MSERRVVYIVIDPTKARSGAAAVVNSLRTIDKATGRVNQQLRSGEKAMQGFSRNFGRLQALLITAQPVRFLSGFMRSLVDADKTITTFKSQLFTVTGDLESAGEAFEYVKDTAQAYAVPINSLTKGFAKLKASMNTPDLMEYNDALFQSTAVLSSVLHLAEYNSERVFNVMIQIMSKGQLMMEELKQQLGEHVPGAIALAAESMGYSVEDMMDRMSKGLISAEEFASGWSELILEKFGPAAEVATKSIQSAMNRLVNVIDGSMIELTQSEAGFAIAQVITTITSKLDGATDYFKQFGIQIAYVALSIDDYVKALKPEDITKFFTATVDLFKAIIDIGSALATGVIFLVTYSDEVKTLSKLLLGTYVAIKTYAIAIIAYNAAIAATSALSIAAAGSLAILAGTVAGLAAGFAGYAIGSYMYEQFELVRWAGNRIAKVLTVLAAEVANRFETIKEHLKAAFDDPINYVAARILRLVRILLDAGDKVLEFFGIDIDNALVADIDEFISETDVGNVAERLANLSEAHDKEIAKIKATYDDMLNYIGDEPPQDDSGLLTLLGLPEDYQQRMIEMQKKLQAAALEGKKAFEKAQKEQDASEQLLKDEDALRQSLESQEEMILRSYQDREMEIMRVGAAINLSEADQRDLSLRNFEEYTQKMIELNQKGLDAKTEQELTYWQQYLANMEKALTTGEELSVNMLDRLTSGIGNAVEDMVFEFTTFEDAFKQLMESMLRALVNALAQMAAQWVVFQITKMLIDKSAAASSAVAQTTQAAATQQQAGLAAFASTAAIPVVGPAAAPEAYLAAIAATSPMVSSIAALSASAAAARAQGGQVQDGQQYLVGERGPELFTAGGTGHITPNHQLQGNSATNVTQVFQMSDNARREAKQAVMDAAPFIKQMAKQAVLEASMQGGPMSRAMGKRR